MAVFEIKDKKYKTEEDLRTVIGYVMGKCTCCFEQNLYHLGQEQLANQMLYLQHCSGKVLRTRIRHWVLSFDTKGWEWEINKNDIMYFMQCFFQSYLNEYQVIYGTHNDNGMEHVHILINPVNINDFHLLHWSQVEFSQVLWDMAVNLYWVLGVALQGVSYIDVRGNLKKANMYSFLYENRYKKEIPLKDSQGRITVYPYRQGMLGA